VTIVEISSFIMVCLSLMTVNKDCHVESAERGCGMTVAQRGVGLDEEAKAEGVIGGLPPISRKFSQECFDTSWRITKHKIDVACEQHTNTDKICIDLNILFTVDTQFLQIKKLFQP